MSQQSKLVCHRIKQDGPELGQQPGGPMIEWAVRRIRNHGAPPLDDILGPEAVLIPLPRSAPFPPNQKNMLWAPHRIAQALVAEGWGQSVQPMLQRVTPVPKSAFAGAGQRPSPKTHLESMTITPTLSAPERIVLVDDVVTKGATFLAAASLVHHAFPHARVEAFALVRTLGLQPEVQRIVDPVVGTISLNQWAGADRRP